MTCPTPCASLKGIEDGKGKFMSEGDSESQYKPEVTAELFVKFLRGEASAAEVEAVGTALRDKDSDLRRWVEQFEAWGQKAFGLRRELLSAGDEMLQSAAARKERERITTFLRQHSAPDRINHDVASRILAAGALPAEESNRTAADYTRANDQMRDLIEGLYPELAGELRKQLDARRRNSGGGDRSSATGR